MVDSKVLTMPVRVMIDTHIYDAIAADSDLKTQIEQYQRDGLIKIVLHTLKLVNFPKFRQTEISGRRPRLKLSG
jgi:hypothetical protein